MLGPPEGWSEEWCGELDERLAMVLADGGIPESQAAAIALEAVRAELLRRIP